MERIFEKRGVIVTGGSFEIGNATAKAFAKRGAKVVIADWVDGYSTLQEIQGDGGDAIFMQCDVSKASGVAGVGPSFITGHALAVDGGWIAS